jgi:uncharacterized repeat protein (TIGR01451 family)
MIIGRSHRVSICLASGVYAGLEPEDMRSWGNSYHDRFTALGLGFEAFELGGNVGQDVVTIARTRPAVPIVTKTDDIDPEDCVGPGDSITYTITVDPAGFDHASVTVVDTLPAGVNYENIMDPQYNAELDAYTWELGALPASHAPVVLSLTVKVKNNAEPAEILHNEVKAESDVGTGYATENTPVCCFGGSVIYVDGSKGSGGNGTSWTMAYNDLQNALARADKGCGNEIWVAKGTYKPGTNVTDSFTIPANVSVYGGFAGNETALEDRNWDIHQTILSGYIGKDESQNDLRNRQVVTMGDNTLLDGMVVRDGYERGIFGQGVDFTISNCIIEDNKQYGIYTVNCNVTFQWCTIRNNGFDGIFQDGANKILSVENCQIYDNHWNGINVLNTIPTIHNNMIYRNGSAGTTYYGIYLNQPSGTATIRNNTLVDNQNEGIRFVGTISPSVRNCILYANHADGGYVDYSGFRELWNSCLTDANDLQRRATPTGINGNLRGNPQFAYPDIMFGNFHLSYNSPCKNTGSNTGIGMDETDIDQDERIIDGTVDIGADEVACEDVSHPLDWNADGAVNMNEFYDFSAAWLTHDPNDPQMPPGIDPNDFVHWNPQCNLDGDYDVDLADLVIFTEDDPQNWLWVACWRQDLQPEQLEMMMSMSVPQAEPQFTSLQVQSVKTAVSVESAPKPIRQQIIEFTDTVRFLEQLWLTDDSIQQEIDAGEWRQFMEKVYQNMIDLKKLENTKTNLKEVEQ